jgi:hypothetical protein
MVDFRFSIGKIAYAHPIASFLDFQKCVAPVLKLSKLPPDSLDEYKAEFGYMGQVLYLHVTNARKRVTA